MNPLLALMVSASIAVPPQASVPEGPRPTLAAQVVEVVARAPIRTEAPVTRAARTSAAGDSLKNGAIVGGVIGGVATAVFASLLCGPYWDPDPTDGDYSPCYGKIAAWTLSGIAGGAAIGAGIDALADRQPLTRPGGRRHFPAPVRALVRVRF
jgi:hypothetical protein